MRRVLALLALFALPAACKKKVVDEAPAPLPRPSAPPAEAPSEIVDALNPPPPAPSPDFAVATDTAAAKQGEIGAVNMDGQRRMQGCLDGLPPSAFSGGVARLSVRYTIGNDGKAREITVEGAGPEASACGKTAIEGLQFPKFNGPPATMAFNIGYSRPQAVPTDAKPPTP